MPTVHSFSGYLLAIGLCFILTILPHQITCQDEEADHCLDWNATVSLVPDRGVNIRVRFSLFPKYMDCFPHGFRMELKNVTLDVDRDGIPVARMRCKRTDITVNYIHILQNASSHLFTELPPGNYCVFVRITRTDDPFGKYRALVSQQIQEIKAPAGGTDDATIKPTQVSEIHVHMYVGICVAVVIIVASAAVGFYVWKKRRSKTCANSAAMDVECDDQRQVATPEDENTRTRVYFLYFHDSKEFERLIQTFVVFLQKVLKVDVVTDFESLNEIMIDANHWVEKTLQDSWEDGTCRETVAEKRNKIIIVESKGIFEFFMDHLNIENRSTDSDENDLNTVAGRALVSIIRNQKALEAYGKLIVTRFKFTPPEYRINCIVPNMRYVIPDQLSYIYDRLKSFKNRGSADVACDYNELSSPGWESTKEYQDLISFIDSM